MLKIKDKIEYIKDRPLLFHAGAVLLLFVLSLGYVYYARVIFSPGWLRQGQGTLALFAALCLLYFAFVLRAKLFKDKNESRFMARVLCTAGLVFVFATPPNQVPDEQSHYLRGVQMSYGRWDFDENYIFPDDVNSLIAHFPTMYNNGYPAKAGNTMADRFADYKKAVSRGEKAENTGIIIFQFIPYIPLAAGIFTARLLGFGALGAYYGGRIANLLFFTLCAYFALKMSGGARRVLFALMALPLSLFITASCNSDSVLFALMYLMFACRLAEKMENKNAALFAVCFAVLVTCKASFIVFAPLIFCFKKEQWQVKIKDKNISRIAYAAFRLGLLAVVYFGMSRYVTRFSNYGPIPRTMADTDPARQLAFILANPIRYRAVFWDSLKNNAFFLFSGGLLGWLDVNLPLVNYLTPVFVIWRRAESAGFMKKDDKVRVIIFLVCSVLTYAVAMTGMYLSWTPVTLPQIIGLQMRYVMPAFTGFALGLAMFIKKRYNPKRTDSSFSLVLMGYIFPIVAAGMMLAVYYLPRRAVVFVA